MFVSRLRTRTFTLLLLPLIAACPECDNLDAQPIGAVEPPILDLGPIPLDTSCQAVLQVTNSGTSDLIVDQATLTGTDGDWTVQSVPSLVGLGDSEDLLINYVAGGTEGERQSTGVEVQTNDRIAEDGILRATITALPTSEVAGVATPKCDGLDADDNDVRLEPCPELNFGAVQTNTPGLPVEQRTGRRNLQVDIVNEGNAELVVQAVVIDGGDGDFAIEAILKGSVIEPLPTTLTPGRAGACEPVAEDSCVSADACNVLSVDVLYTPTSLGGDVAELVVLTDAAEGAELRVPLNGTGADVGIALLPDVLNFADVGEGATETKTTRVLNFGTNDAPVNTSCIDVGGDGSCDGDCTGGDEELVLEGTLGCNVKKTDGSNEGKGFVLAPTDAQQDGDDERDIEVTWSPVAGAASIPAGTVLRLETSILGDRVYEVPLGGGGAGVLALDVEAADVCGELLCIGATGTPGDTMTWVGTVDFTLQNDGDATLDISGFAWDAPAGVDDDFTLTDQSDVAVDLGSPGISLAPAASVDLRVSYANNDASQEDLADLVVTHTGLGGETTIPFNVLPPQ